MLISPVRVWPLRVYDQVVIERTARWIRRLVVGFLGLLVLATGLVLIVLPGPAVVVIPFGLAILSLEFAWARYLLRRLQDRVGLGPTEPVGERPDRSESDDPP